MNREDLIQHIDNRLNSVFVKDGERWTLDKEQQGPPQTIIVNGQKLNQPGLTRHVNMLFEVFGDGMMKEGEKEEPFIQLHIKLDVDGQTNLDTEECIYYDEIDIIDELLSRL